MRIDRLTYNIIRYGNVKTRSSALAFTLVEVLLSIAIFAMVLASIYSCWSAILRGSKSAQEAAAAVQRSRIAVRAIEEALVTAQMFTANPQHYYFVAENSGDFATLSLVARLPDTFPGSGLYGEENLRHVSFTVEPGEFSRNQLMLRQWPLLMPTNSTSPPYTIVLGRDVYKFNLEFYDPVKKDWVDEWKYTNQMPPLVKVRIGMGEGGSYSARGKELVTRVVAIPSVIVPREWQLPIGAPMPGQPGAPVIPGRPGVPGIPVQPGMPQNPAVPNLPVQPGMGIPRTPGAFPGGVNPGFGNPNFMQRIQ